MEHAKGGVVGASACLSAARKALDVAVVSGGRS
jgi:hypothetical protein